MFIQARSWFLSVTGGCLEMRMTAMFVESSPSPEMSNLWQVCLSTKLRTQPSGNFNQMKFFVIMYTIDHKVDLLGRNTLQQCHTGLCFICTQKILYCKVFNHFHWSVYEVLFFLIWSFLNGHFGGEIGQSRRKISKRTSLSEANSFSLLDCH